jgi:dihydropteroate synthase-like protein
MGVMSRILFVTGRLAAEALAETLRTMNPAFEYDIAVMKISVAALMPLPWIARFLRPPAGCDLIMIPGLCEGDPSVIEQATGIKTVHGPKDLKDIPAYFGQPRDRAGYGEYRLKIFAEIVDAPKLSLDEILARAEYYRANGADVIDLGWPARGDFPDVERTLVALKDRGFVVSLDTFHRDDVLRANRIGFDYLLSVNGSNLDLAREVSARVVVIPDFGAGLDSLERNIAQLDAWGVPYIIDPVLDPLNFGFTESLHRFYEVRHRHPEVEMLMGLGNITELTDADSPGINALMAGVMTELNIGYVLTTEVISWARGAVRELDIARRLMHYAARRRTLPKHIDDRLLTVKDPPFGFYTEDELRAMQRDVKDQNLRIFTDDRFIYVFNRALFVKGTNIREIFRQLGVTDASHAFYLGQELQKAALAVQLGKKYIQEQPLRWGYLGEEGQRSEEAEEPKGSDGRA